MKVNSLGTRTEKKRQFLCPVTSLTFFLKSSLIAAINNLIKPWKVVIDMFESKTRQIEIKLTQELNCNLLSCQRLKSIHQV